MYILGVKASSWRYDALSQHMQAGKYQNLLEDRDVIVLAHHLVCWKPDKMGHVLLSYRISYLFSNWEVTTRVGKVNFYDAKILSISHMFLK